MLHNQRAVSAAAFLTHLFFSAALLLGFQHSPAWAQQLWPDHTPLIDGDDGTRSGCTDGSLLYKCQFHGFLYGHWNDNGSNTPDATHNTDGIARANIVKLQQKIGVVLIGMSHWTKEGCGNQPPNIQIDQNHNPLDTHCSNGPPNDDRHYSFIYKATSNSQVNNSKVVFADCAQIGAVAGYWINDNSGPPGGPARLYSNCKDILTGLGLTEAQVQVVLFKQADSGQTSPPQPNPPLLELPTGAGTFAGCPGLPLTGQPDACNLQAFMTTIAQQVKLHYTNVQQMFVHSRIYSGYADSNEFPLNPEPYAYEQGFADKWLIQAQVDEVNGVGPSHPPVLDYNHNVAPWIDWGTYM